MPPTSCGTVVAIGSGSDQAPDRTTLFAACLCRPGDELQQWTHHPRSAYAEDFARPCTRTTLRERPSKSEMADKRRTWEVVLNQPMWSFGAWSGVNECGVAVATDWVRVREAAPPRQSDSAALLAPDLVRLALERAKSARRAAELVIRLVEQHGLGHDARIGAAAACGARFVMADAAEAWLLEAACGFWALQPLRDGVFCWGNALSIGAADFLADGAVEHARQRGWYDARRDGRFCFARAFGPADASADQSAPDAGRLPCGHTIPVGAHTLATMMHDILRHACSDHAEATCLDAAAAPGGMPGLAHLSALAHEPSKRVHLFTFTPCPHDSMLKPFFLMHDGGATLDSRMQQHLQADGAFHRRRQLALQHGRIDHHSSRVPVLRKVPAEQRRVCYIPDTLRERLHFLELIGIEKALTLCALPLSFRKREHEALRRDISDAMQRADKKLLKVETKMLYPVPLPMDEWERVFDKYVADTRANLCEKALMREEYEYELFAQEYAPDALAWHRVRGVQLTQMPGEHLCMPLADDVQEQPDAQHHHVYRYSDNAKP